MKLKDILYSVVLLTVFVWWGIIAFTHMDFTLQRLLITFWLDYLVGIVAIVGMYITLYGKE